MTYDWFAGLVLLAAVNLATRLGLREPGSSFVIELRSRRRSRVPP